MSDAAIYVIVSNLHRLRRLAQVQLLEERAKPRHTRRAAGAGEAPRPKASAEDKAALAVMRKAVRQGRLTL